MPVASSSKLPRGILGIWRLANGRLERLNNRGLLSAWKHFRGLKAGKRQAWTPAMECLVQAVAERCKGLKASRQKLVPHLRWSQAPPLPWWRQGPGDILYIRTYIPTWTWKVGAGFCSGIRDMAHASTFWRNSPWTNAQFILAGRDDDENIDARWASSRNVISG